MRVPIVTIVLALLAAPAAAQSSCDGCEGTYQWSIKTGETWSGWAAYSDGCDELGYEGPAKQWTATPAPYSYCDTSAIEGSFQIAVKVCGNTGSGTQNNQMPHDCVGPCTPSTRKCWPDFGVSIMIDTTDTDDTDQDILDFWEDNNLSLKIDLDGTTCITITSLNITAGMIGGWYPVCDALEYGELCNDDDEEAREVPCTSTFMYKNTTCSPNRDTTKVEEKNRAICTDCELISESPIAPIPSDEYHPALYILLGRTIDDRVYRLSAG